MWEQSKRKIEDFIQDDRLYVSLLLVLVALAAFGFGRLAERAGQSAAIGTVITMTESSQEDVDTVVASKAGTKYHLPWCAGAQQMSEGNKLYFNTRAEAEAAGYAPAANCRGL